MPIVIETIKGLARVVAFFGLIHIINGSAVDAVMNHSDGKFLERVQYGLVAQSVTPTHVVIVFVAVFIGWFNVPWRTAK